MSEYIYGTDGHEGHWLTGEEIVRCRDCRYFDGSKYYGCDLLDISVPDMQDGFCAWGETKGDA